MPQSGYNPTPAWLGLVGSPSSPSTNSEAWMSAMVSATVPRTCQKQHVHVQGLAPHPDERNAAPFWKAKKWALHTAARMFNRYGTPSIVADKDHEQAFAELWTRHCANPFLEVALELLSRYARVSSETPSPTPKPVCGGLASGHGSFGGESFWRRLWSCCPAMPGCSAKHSSEGLCAENKPDCWGLAA